MNCPNCKSGNVVKYGMTRQKQRYLCKQCATQFTEQSRSKSKSQFIVQKRHAFILYVLGMSYRNIAATLNTSHMSIYNWLQPYEVLISRLKAAQAPELVSIKEAQKRLSKHLFLTTHNSQLNTLCIDLENGQAFISHNYPYSNHFSVQNE